MTRILMTLRVTSASLPGVVRSFTRLSSAAAEASASRIFAGQHFRVDQAGGQRPGRDVADFVADNVLPRIHTRANDER